MGLILTRDVNLQTIDERRAAAAAARAAGCESKARLLEATASALAEIRWERRAAQRATPAFVR